MGAKTVAHTGIRTMDLPIPHQQHCPLGYPVLIVAILQPIFYQQQALLRSESNRDPSKRKHESVKKSLEKPKNILEEKRKNGQAKNLHKKTNTFTIIALL